MTSTQPAEGRVAGGDCGAGAVAAVEPDCRTVPGLGPLPPQAGPGAPDRRPTGLRARPVAACGEAAGRRRQRPRSERSGAGQRRAQCAGTGRRPCRRSTAAAPGRKRCHPAGAAACRTAAGA
ncbi:hypothetical protein G6F63_014328 [Rhizopus arrhizus]|nr:hypothetical protein G6F63_014328 [Rhizopus arrhizus]